jgi:hypothetical protein
MDQLKPAKIGPPLALRASLDARTIGRAFKKKFSLQFSAVVQFFLPLDLLPRRRLVFRNTEAPSLPGKGLPPQWRFPFQRSCFHFRNFPFIS